MIDVNVKTHRFPTRGYLHRLLWVASDGEPHTFTELRGCEWCAHDLQQALTYGLIRRVDRPGRHPSYIITEAGQRAFDQLEDVQPYGSIYRKIQEPRWNEQRRTWRVSYHGYKWVGVGVDPQQYWAEYFDQDLSGGFEDYGNGYVRPLKKGKTW
jgi:hypothetical protein